MNFLLLLADYGVCCFSHPNLSHLFSIPVCWHIASLHLAWQHNITKSISRWFIQEAEKQCGDGLLRA